MAIAHIYSDARNSYTNDQGANIASEQKKFQRSKSE